MSLTERSRAALYQGLITVINDEQAVQEMMSYFPARDVEEPVTKEFLRAELSDAMAALGREVRAELAAQREELGGATATLGRELRSEMAAQRDELSAATATLGRDLRSEIHRLALINIGSLVAFAGVVIAAVRL